MRPSIALLAVVALLATACGGDEPASSGGREQATLVVENVTLVAGEQNAVRIGFEAVEPLVQARIEFRPSRASVNVCPLPSLTAAVPALESCRRDIGSGVREPIGRKGMTAIALVVRGQGDVTAQIQLEYDVRGRDVSIRLPLVRPPRSGPACADNACNPFFELLPSRGGRFTARASWTGARDGTLVLLQGRVRARSFTATGIPYAEAARADGSSPLRVESPLRAPGEYALALRMEPGRGSSPMRDIAIDASWP